MSSTTFNASNLSHLNLQWNTVAQLKPNETFNVANNEIQPDSFQWATENSGLIGKAWSGAVNWSYRKIKKIDTQVEINAIFNLVNKTKNIAGKIGSVAQKKQQRDEAPENYKQLKEIQSSLPLAFMQINQLQNRIRHSRKGDAEKNELIAQLNKLRNEVADVSTLVNEKVAQIKVWTVDNFKPQIYGRIGEVFGAPREGLIADRFSSYAVKEVLSELYGRELSERVIRLYGFDKSAEIDADDLSALIVGILVNANESDLAYIIRNKSAHYELTGFAFFNQMSEEDSMTDWLQQLRSSLNDVSFEKCLAESKPYRHQLQRDLNLLKAFDGLPLRSGTVLGSDNNFVEEVHREFSTSEYLAKIIAPSIFLGPPLTDYKPQFLIPYRLSDGSVCMAEATVIQAPSEGGVGALKVQPITDEKSDPVYVLFSNQTDPAKEAFQKDIKSLFINILVAGRIQPDMNKLTIVGDRWGALAAGYMISEFLPGAGRFNSQITSFELQAFNGCVFDPAFSEDLHQKLKSYENRESPVIVCQNIGPNAETTDRRKIFLGEIIPRSEEDAAKLGKLTPSNKIVLNIYEVGASKGAKGGVTSAAYAEQSSMNAVQDVKSLVMNIYAPSPSLLVFKEYRVKTSDDGQPIRVLIDLEPPFISKLSSENSDFEETISDIQEKRMGAATPLTSVTSADQKISYDDLLLSPYQERDPFNDFAEVSALKGLHFNPNPLARVNLATAVNNALQKSTLLVPENVNIPNMQGAEQAPQAIPSAPGELPPPPPPPGGLPPPPPPLSGLPPPVPIQISPQEKFNQQEQNRLAREHESRLKLKAMYSEGTSLDATKHSTLKATIEANQAVLNDLLSMIEKNPDLEEACRASMEKINESIDAGLNTIDKNKKITFSSEPKVLTKNFAEKFTTSELKLILGAFASNYESLDDVPVNAFMQDLNLLEECKAEYEASDEKKLMEPPEFYNGIFKNASGAYTPIILNVLKERINGAPEPLHKPKAFDPNKKVVRVAVKNNDDSNGNKPQGMMDQIKGGFALKTNTGSKSPAINENAPQNIFNEIAAGKKLRSTVKQEKEEVAANSPVDFRAGLKKVGTGQNEQIIKSKILNNLHERATAIANSSNQSEVMRIGEQIANVQDQIRNVGELEDRERFTEELERLQRSLAAEQQRPNQANDYLRENFLGQEDVDQALEAAKNHPFVVNNDLFEKADKYIRNS